jgi:hypothetical protein
MKFEVGNLKCERRRGLGVSNFTLHLSNFHLAATIKRNFEELGV